jgi:hypothetical protein
MKSGTEGLVDRAVSKVGKQPSRFALGLVFITGVEAVRSGSHRRCPPSLSFFLTKFALVGIDNVY